METRSAAALDLDLAQDTFFGDTLCKLAGGLEEAVGLRSAATLVAEVGTQIGDRLSAEYSAALGRHDWDPEQIAQVLVDLKARIGGAFAVDRVSDDEIVLAATRCPFADRVHGRASLCMMTTTVFGTITAQAAGYARVRIDEAIALGDGRCRVTIKLKKADHEEGYEFFAETA